MPKQGDFTLSKDDKRTFSLLKESAYTLDTPQSPSTSSQEKADYLKDDREGEEQGRQKQDQDQNEEEKKEKKSPFFKKEKDEKGYAINPSARMPLEKPNRKIEDSPWNIKASFPTQKSSADSEDDGGYPVAEGVESIYVRFLALMARVLGQAEASAQELYQKIKTRTDQVDLLSSLLSKINLEKDKIDWSKNEEMKKLVDKARELGADIPEGKYSWTKEEKAQLKENIQMKRENMEKITQLERTDMQRFLQEASQCHQLRSHILKMLKEVVDVIISNFRP